MGVSRGLQVGAVMILVSTSSGCLFQEARVDRWTDLEKPCQPHGFYIAPTGDTLADVAKTFKTDETILRRYNAWL